MDKHDLTGHRAAISAALSESLAVALIDNTDDLIWAIDHDFRLIFFNRVFSNHMLQYQDVAPGLGEVVFAHSMNETSNQEWRGYYQRVLVNGESFRMERSASSIPASANMEYSFNPIRAEGKIAGAIMIGRDINERKMAELSLLESVQNARAIMEAASSAIIMLNRDGIVLDTNSAHAARFGLTRNDFIGKCIWSFLPDDVAERRKGNMLRVFETGQPVTGEDLRDGKWTEFIIYPVFDQKGKVSKTAIYANDITEKKLAEEKLLDSEQKARALLDAIPDMMFRLNRSGTYLDFKAPKDKLHYQSDTIIGKTTVKSHPPILQVSLT